MYIGASRPTQSKSIRNTFVESTSANQSSTQQSVGQETPDYDIHVDIADESEFLGSLGCCSLDLFLSSIELRFKRWSHQIYRDDFARSETYYSGEVFTVDSSDGQVLMWNLMESATQLRASIPYRAIGPNYNYTRNSSVINFGFGRITNQLTNFSTCINCYTHGGSLSFRWHCI